MAGPFTDFPAVVQAVNANMGKLRVTVHVFGRDSPFDLDCSQATRLETNAE
jgi:transcription antitermination factor NusG